MPPVPRQTERVDPAFAGIDTWPNEQILEALLNNQTHAVDSVRAALPAISKAAEAVASRLQNGGSLCYAGAGTSIRIAVQDGSELPATYGVSEDRLRYLIAGGPAAIFETFADKEDSTVDGVAAAQICTDKDALIAVAASGRTPFTIAAAETARARGCFVISLVNVPGSLLGKVGDVEVVLDTGAEVIAGSTRMGAGTAQKTALNLISTLACIKLGGVYDGMMVAMRADNEKLKQRAAQIVSAIANVSLESAIDALTRTHDIKTAILMSVGGHSSELAVEQLSGANGNLRLALHKLQSKS